MVDPPPFFALLLAGLRNRSHGPGRRCTLQALFLLFFICVDPYADILYVPQPYTTIQKAIDVAADGDEIIVAPGRYVENIHMLGKNIVLRSTNPQDLAAVEATIIDGNEAGTVVTLLGPETTVCVVTGFTITNGFAHQGGGFHGSNGEQWPELGMTHATIESNIIRNNRCGSYTELVFSEGAGVYRCLGVIRDNIIIENEAVGLEICDDWPYDCDYEPGLGGRHLWLRRPYRGQSNRLQ